MCLVEVGWQMHGVVTHADGHTGFTSSSLPFTAREHLQSCNSKLLEAPTIPVPFNSCIVEKVRVVELCRASLGLELTAATAMYFR
jgi:hypothetical protein